MKRKHLSVPTATNACGGFTLVELLAVMAIIAILAGIILGITTVANQKASIAQAMADMELIKIELQTFKLEYGAFPDVGDTTNMVDATVFKSYRDDEASEFSLIDPWGTSYIYIRLTPHQYDLWSRGPDTLPNTEDDLPENRGVN